MAKDNTTLLPSQSHAPAKLRVGSVWKQRRKPIDLHELHS